MTMTTSGAARVVQWRFESLLADGGAVRGILGVGHDVTERRRAEGGSWRERAPAAHAGRGDQPADLDHGSRRDSRRGDGQLVRVHRPDRGGGSRATGGWRRCTPRSGSGSARGGRPPCRPAESTTASTGCAGPTAATGGSRRVPSRCRTTARGRGTSASATTSPSARRRRRPRAAASSSIAWPPPSPRASPAPRSRPCRSRWTSPSARPGVTSTPTARASTCSRPTACRSSPHGSGGARTTPWSTTPR